MVQYPTNIYPSGTTFDASVSDDNNRVAFTFNGDIMSNALYHVFDYNTGEQVLETASGYQDHSPIGYNGTEFESARGFFGSLTNGKDYAFQILIPQFTMTGNPREPLCDMFVLRGTTQENYVASDGHIVIEDKISNIYEWSTLSSEGWRNVIQWWGVNFAICQIVIGDQKRTITAYQPSTGKAAISEAFTGSIPAGTKYQIYCNYKVSDLYYFQCRSTPSVTVSLEMGYGVGSGYGLNHYVSATYSQAQNALIRYYTVELWYSQYDSDTPWYKIDETEKIYSQEIKYNFYDDFLLRPPSREAQTTYRLYYKAVVNIVTVDGMTISAESSPILCGNNVVEVPSTNIEAIVTDYDRADTFYNTIYNAFRPKHSVDLRWTQAGLPSNTTVCIYRENVQTGETEIIESGYDVTIPTKGTFKYYAIPRQTLGGGAYLNGISTTEITLNLKGYSITELILRDEEYQYGTRPRYQIGDQWKFVGEVQDTTVTQNGDRALHVGYNTYPTLTRTDTNYMSGTLSAMLGYVDCTTKKYVDDIDLVRAWRDFITRPCIYMLKSQKGDVWIVNITDTPTTTYSEMQKELPTTISFNWAECCSVNDIKISQRNSN